MKLLFLHVESHKTLKGFTANLDADEAFYVERVPDAQGTFFIKYKRMEHDSLPDRFWVVPDANLQKDGKSKKRTHALVPGEVESVTGIIGKNGSGKTSIASLFYNICRPFDDPEGRVPRYQCIYKCGEKYICMHGGNWQFRLDKLPIEIQNNWEWVECRQHDLPFSFIYYSPYTTLEPVVGQYGGSFKDLSTGGLLRDLANAGKFYSDSVFSEMAIRDYIRILRFIAAIKKHDVAMPSGLPLPLPLEVEVLPNDTLVRDLKVICEGLEKGPHYSMDPYDVRVLIEHIMDICSAECFVIKILGTFFASMLLSDRERLVAGDKAIVELYGFVDEYYSFAKKVRIRHDSLLELSGVVDDMKAGTDMTASIRTTLTTILKTLKTDERLRSVCQAHKVSFDNFVKLLIKVKEYYDKKFGNQRDAFRYYSSNPVFLISRIEHMVQVSEFADLLVRVNPFILFMNFKFIKMSSGESAYLSMFGRLHETFANHIAMNGESVPSLNPDVVLYLDEAETTLHPEWQRYLVYALLWFIGKFGNGRKVHLFFASHSPILLSDIPKSNVLYIDRTEGNAPRTVTGWPDRLVGFDTFANNIFDLYKMVFTPETGAIGQFASVRIADALAEVSKIVKERMANRDRALQNVSAPKQLSTISRKTLGLLGDKRLKAYLQDLKESGLL